MGGKERRRAAILTGERGVGKTTLCIELAKAHPEFSGIVSPAIFDSTGRKVGFSCQCLQSGEQWDLGRSDAPLEGPSYGTYTFSAHGIARGIECVRAALGRPGPIVILDEIGPLEMELGAGFFPLLPLLASAGDLLLVTRPRFAARLAGGLPSHACRRFFLSPGGRGLTARIVEYFSLRASPPA